MFDLNFGTNFAHTRVICKIEVKISQIIVFGIPRSSSSCRTVIRRSCSIASRTRSILSKVFVVEGRPERESLLTEVRSPLKRLYHSFSELKTKFDANSLIWFFSHC